VIIFPDVYECFACLVEKRSTPPGPQSLLYKWQTNERMKAEKKKNLKKIEKKKSDGWDGLRNSLSIIL
jgi:hypothetical protein